MERVHRSRRNEVDGKVVSREEKLSLKAGDSRELSFDFGDAWRTRTR